MILTAKRYPNVGIMKGDGQASVLEAAVLGGELETELAFLARHGGGPLWICSLDMLFTLPRMVRSRSRPSP
jgi:hypothetical protein